MPQTDMNSDPRFYLLDSDEDTIIRTDVDNFSAPYCVVDSNDGIIAYVPNLEVCHQIVRALNG